MTNLSNATSGTVPDALLPSRISPTGKNVTDWDTAIEVGWYFNAASPATNAPGTGYFYGVVTRNGGRRTQTVWDNSFSSADTKKWQRTSADSGVTWSAWYRLRESEAELDARYVSATGDETVAGSKTFVNTITIPRIIMDYAGTSTIEMGRTDGTASSPFIDFHSGATATDYDSRIMARNGNGTAGQGEIAFYAGSISFNSDISIPGTSDINFTNAGIAPPSFTTRSVGTKIVLYPSLTSTVSDFALGIDTSTMWMGVRSTSDQFKWYGGTTLAATLTGTGNLTLVGSLSTTSATFTGNASFRSLLNLQDGTGATLGYAGIVPGAGQWATGSAAGDMFIRSTQDMLFSTAAGGVTRMTINGATGLVSMNNNLSVAGVITADNGGGAMQLKSGSKDHAYMEFYARTATPSTRSGYFGYANAASIDVTLRNEVASGNINLTTNGGVVAVSGVLDADRAIYEKALSASGTSGTVTLDASAGGVYYVSPTGNITTLNITNVPSGTNNAVTITLCVDGTAGTPSTATIAGPSGALWMGAAPTPVSGKARVYTFMSTNGGSSWYCSGAVQV
jgi:hypothetical protein